MSGFVDFSFFFYFYWIDAELDRGPTTPCRTASIRISQIKIKIKTSLENLYITHLILRDPLTRDHHRTEVGIVADPRVREAPGPYHVRPKLEINPTQKATPLVGSRFDAWIHLSLGRPKHFTARWRVTLERTNTQTQAFLRNDVSSPKRSDQVISRDSTAMLSELLTV